MRTQAGHMGKEAMQPVMQLEVTHMYYDTSGL